MKNCSIKLMALGIVLIVLSICISMPRTVSGCLSVIGGYTIMSGCLLLLKPEKPKTVYLGYSEDDIKDAAKKFFYHWYNQRGTNTEHGFDEWWKENKNKYDKYQRKE